MTLSTAEHQGVIEGMEPLSLHLSLVEPRLELPLCHLEVLDVCRRAVQKRNFARLLVRHGKDVLQTAVAIPELIAAALLRLDALAADLLTTDIVVGEVAHARLEVVVVVAVNVRTPRAPLRLARRHAGDVHRVEAMRAGDGRN